MLGTILLPPMSFQYELFALPPCYFFSLALQPQFGPWPTSMKLSVSLLFSRSWSVGRTPWAGDQLVARPLPVHKHRKTHPHTQTLNIHALNGIRTHYPGYRASEDSACLRPLGYRDRPTMLLLVGNSSILLRSGLSDISHLNICENQLRMKSKLEFR
jgi:hypothetical protein